MAKKDEILSLEDAPRARSLLDRAISTLGRELHKLEALSKISEKMPLAPEDMQALNNITKTLVAVDKNSKEHPEDEDPFKDMTDEELVQQAKLIMGNKGKK